MAEHPPAAGRGPRPSRLTALGAVAAVAVIAFLILAGQVKVAGTVSAFDQAFSNALVHRSSPGLTTFFEALTWIGSATPLGVASAIVALGLIIRRHYAAAVWWIVGQAGAGAVVLTLKAIVARSRPEFAYATEIARGWSFPSGHAVRIFVFCGLATYLVLRYVRSPNRARLLAALAVALAVLVGFSRVYLGAHFLTDVVGGFLAGTAWVMVCVAGTEIGLRRASRFGLPTPFANERETAGPAERQ